MAEIKTLSDEKLTNFLNGEKLVIQGNEIQPEEIRIMYSFTGEKSAELMEKYEADSSEDLLVLLDITPDESMVKEGQAREVVIRVQKLRKTAGLVPSDEVTVFYTIKPQDHMLAQVVAEYHDYIETSTNTPLRQGSAKGKVLKKEQYDLKGAKMELVIVGGFPSDYSGGSSSNGCPPVPWVNVQLVGARTASYVKSDRGGLLLQPNYTLARMEEDVQDLFGIYGVKLNFYLSADRSTPLTSLADLSGKVVYVFKANDVTSCSSEPSSSGFNCRFLNVDKGGKVSTLLLENPVGTDLVLSGDSLKFLAGNSAKKIQLFTTKDKKESVKLGNLAKMSGQTLFL